MRRRGASFSKPDSAACSRKIVGRALDKQTPACQPMRCATSAIIHQSGRASPGGGRNARCREMQRSELVTVPSFSPHAAAGRTISAKRRRIGRPAIADDDKRTGAERRAHAVGARHAGGRIGVENPQCLDVCRRCTASNRSTALRPGRVAMRGAFQKRPHAIDIGRIGKAHMRRELVGKAADFAAAHRVGLAGQRKRPHAGPSDAAGRQMTIDDRIDLVGPGRGLVGALGVESHAAIGRGEPIVKAREIRGRHIGDRRDVGERGRGCSARSQVPRRTQTRNPASRPRRKPRVRERCSNNPANTATSEPGRSAR